MSTLISRVDLGSAGSGRSAGIEKGGGGGGKRVESVSNPIPFVRGKVKKRVVVFRCESCNKVHWFKSFFSFFLSLVLERWHFPLFSGFPSFLLPTNHLTTFFCFSDLTPPKLLEQTQMGTHHNRTKQPNSSKHQ